MANTYFGFESELPALGVGKYDALESELLNSEFEEEEYDALNDETFGADVSGVEDWENVHEKMSTELEQKNRTQRLGGDHLRDSQHTTSVSSIGSISKRVSTSHVKTSLGDSGVYSCDVDQEYHPADDDDFEHCISHLVLDDELDDPAIMNMSKGQPITVKPPQPSFYGSCSPPPPAIIGSDHVGSPSTKSIWTSPQRIDRSGSFSTVLPNLQNPSHQKDLSFQDPSIVGISKDLPFKPPLQTQNAPLTSSQQPLIPNARTVDEVERDLLNFSPIPPGARSLEDIERDMISRTRSVSLSDVVRELSSGRLSPQPNGFPSTLGSTPLRGNPHTQRSTQYPAGSPVLNDRLSPPSRSLPIDMGICISPPSVGFASSPPATSPFGPQKLNMSAPMLVQPYLNRMVPPQVGFHQPHLLVGQIHPNQALLGAPLRFPPTRHPSGMSPPSMMSFNVNRPHFITPQVPYPDALQFRRPLAPPHIRRPFMPMVQPRQRFPPRPEFYQRTRTVSNGEVDEYENLMTQKEKDWLIKIQMLQLQSSNPYLDDYYYTTYTMKKKLAETTKQGGDQSCEPKLLVPETTKSETRVYKPAQFEGSLGKLQAVSVNYPRKIIDVDIMHPDDSEVDVNIANKELRKFRQVLLEIEKLYATLLSVDELDKKMAALPKELQEPLEETKRTCILSMYNSLSTAIASEEKFTHIMTIRKGKNLVLRSLPLFTAAKRYHILLAVLRNWTPIMKRVLQDPVLLKFVHRILELISTADLATLVEMGRAMHNYPMEGVLRSTSPTCHRSHFIAAFQNKVGISAVNSLISRAEELYVEDKELDNELQNHWCKVIVQTVDVLCSVADGSLSQLQDQSTSLLNHFKRFPLEQSKVEAVEIKLRLILPDACGSGDS